MRTRDIERVKAWKQAAERPVLLDLLLAVVLSWAVMKKAAFDGQPAAGDVVVALGAFLGVLLRRVHPLLALGIATAATAGAVLNGVNNFGLIVALGVITFSIAAHTNRRKGWICAVSASATIYVSGLIVAVEDWWRFATLGVLAWVFMAAAAGDAARTHKAYIREVEERARHAEQTREEEARRRVLDERMRIARELHDIVAHHIAVISVQAGAAAHVLPRSPEQVGPVLGRIREASDTVLREIQSVVGVLRDEGELDSTEPAPGLARLPELLEGLTTTDFRVRRQMRGVVRDLPAVVDLAAYRIVQEALTNAHRYGTGVANLRVEYAPSGVIIEITNDVRPALQQPGSGYGLLGMRERAVSAGGQVTVGATDDGRFRVHAVLPTGEAGAREPGSRFGQKAPFERATPAGFARTEHETPSETSAPGCDGLPLLPALRRFKGEHVMVARLGDVGEST